ncbi:MAG TPA: DEAD/DEAH box helicase [Armatimonadota bacterium]|nr:DEAD/DEAH box helicase [Armatimonadota bacterium]
MSAILPLRPYQRAALDALQEQWKTAGNRLAVVLPTGGGKTVCFAHLAKEHLDRHPGERVLILVHTDELVLQAHAKVQAVAPHLDAGIVKASRNDVRADVIVASVQTLRSEARRRQIRHVGLVIVDECHHATARTYRTILEHYGCMGDRAVLAAGFTATLARGDGGPLGEIWQDVAFSRDIGWMVRKGYLIPPRGRAVEVPDLDLSGVKRTRADFREGELGDALVSSFAPEVIAQAYREHASDRSGIMFCPTVASAKVMAEAMRHAGFTCEVVHGGLPVDERRAIIGRLESGQTQVVANCMVLTEGFDSPRVSCVVVARPTQSKPLYVQMVGRGLRVDPSRPYEEQDCLILDVVGASAKHDLRSIADLSDKPLDPRKAREGKTLLELEDEFDSGEGAEQDPENHYVGPVAVREFDPLAARSTRTWLRTTKGTYYIPAGTDAYVFLVPDGPGTWSVCWVTKVNKPYVCPARMHDPDCMDRHGKRGAITRHTGLDLELAMTWAEDLAVDMGADTLNLANRKASWRRKRITEYPKMAARAKALGIAVRESMRAGEVSDLISKFEASPRIDAVARALTEQMGRVAA